MKRKERRVTFEEADAYAKQIGHSEGKRRILRIARKVGTGVDELILNDGSRRITIKPDRTTADMFLIIEEKQ